MLKRVLFLSFSFCLLFSCQNESKVKKLKFAHALNPTHPVHLAIENFKQNLEKLSDGKMSVDIYPSQQLGSERVTLELLQIGSLDLTKVSAAVLENFVPEFKVLGIPYLFKNRAHIYETMDSEAGNYLLQSGQDIRLVGLGFYDAGSRSFYTAGEPIDTPDKLKGKKIRTMESPMAMQMIESMNGSPTPISFGELYTALQTNMVDGAENNPPSFYLSKHYEVCKYYVLDEHTSIPDVIMMGKASWEKLSEQEKVWVKEAMKKSVEYQRGIWQESEKDCLNKLEEEGVKIINPDKEPFKNSVKSIFEKYKTDQDFEKFIELMPKK